MMEKNKRTKCNQQARKMKNSKNPQSKWNINGTWIRK